MGERGGSDEQGLAVRPESEAAIDPVIVAGGGEFHSLWFSAFHGALGK